MVSTISGNRYSDSGKDALIDIDQSVFFGTYLYTVNSCSFLISEVAVHARGKQ
jgi:hypothetical protein